MSHRCLANFAFFKFIKFTQEILVELKLCEGWQVLNPVYVKIINKKGLKYFFKYVLLKKLK
jgi:hypothetical protein